MDAMRRHPSFLAKQRAASPGNDSQRIAVASGSAATAQRRRERFRLVDTKTR
jgi:hypothetical protein